jgi:hypothetical protein
LLHANPELQTFPHVPQFFASVRKSTSQPSAVEPLQFPQPPLHAPMVHMASLHAAVPFGIAQTFAHLPQFIASVRKSTSQPSAVELLQFPQPALHVLFVHEPLMQEVAWLGMAGQELPHAPQSVTVSSGVVITLPTLETCCA